MKVLVPTVLTALLLAGCAVIPPASPPPPIAMQGPPGAELIGRQVRLETGSGQTSMLHFAPGGVVHAQFGQQQVAGSWVATNNQLCFAWPGASRECWPYNGPLQPGQTISLTSDLGNVVRVTLQ